MLCRKVAFVTDFIIIYDIIRFILMHQCVSNVQLVEVEVCLFN